MTLFQLGKDINLTLTFLSRDSYFHRLLHPSPCVPHFSVSFIFRIILIHKKLCTNGRVPQKLSDTEKRQQYASTWKYFFCSLSYNVPGFVNQLHRQHITFDVPSTVLIFWYSPHHCTFTISPVFAGYN